MAMLKKLLKKKALISTLIVCVVLTTFTSVVFAAQVSSPMTIYGPVSGYTYGNQAILYDDSPPLMYADGWVQSNTNVPVGYMGTKGKLYREGVLCNMKDWIYNNDIIAGFGARAKGNCGAGYYSANGQTAAYNGNGYDTQIILTTPKLYGGSGPATVSSTGSSAFSAPTNEDIASIKVNKYGETYGSAENVAPDSEPDLILAYGVDGTLGYVRAKDLNTEMPKTPEEAMSKQRSAKAQGGFRDIKLYDVDGKKVIGTFRIDQDPTIVKEVKK